MQRLIYKLLIVGGLAILVSCSKNENPVAPEPGGLNAVGCVIMQGEADIVRADKDGIKGGFAIEERVQSPMLSFYLIDKNGTLFQPDDEKLLLAWDVRNQMIADFIQYQTDGVWNFRLKGFEAGNTVVNFKVMGDDFESLDMPIRVIQSSGGGLAK